MNKYTVEFIDKTYLVFEAKHCLLTNEDNLSGYFVFYNANSTDPVEIVPFNQVKHISIESKK